MDWTTLLIELAGIAALLALIVGVAILRVRRYEKDGEDSEE